MGLAEQHEVFATDANGTNGTNANGTDGTGTGGANGMSPTLPKSGIFS